LIRRPVLLQWTRSGCGKGARLTGQVISGRPLSTFIRSPSKGWDSLPYPEFGDYFQRLAHSPLSTQIDPLLLFESARGCWWGAKTQCTFCGLNGGSIVFRSKSALRVIEELRYLRRTHGVRRACATDNILDFRYFRSMLPLLKEAEIDLELEYELKTNLSRPQVELLRAAGVRAAQLGIESLSTPVLRLMRKGVTASQNIQTLKWLTAAGMEVKWNFLHGFPGEDPGAYADLPDLIAKLVHLTPPQADGRVRIDRFSPYFESPEAFGLPPPSADPGVSSCLSFRRRGACQPGLLLRFRGPPVHNRGHRALWSTGVRAANPCRSGKLARTGRHRDPARSRSPRGFVGSLRHPSCRQVL